jgi:hypothetical protein
LSLEICWARLHWRCRSTAAVVSNSGNVTLKATSAGALGDGAGDTIAFTQIKTAATAGFFPTLVNDGRTEFDVTTRDRTDISIGAQRPR